jgi:uncharacterized protein YbjT (DUF2867 family)
MKVVVQQGLASLGGALVPRLLADGHDVRVPMRAAPAALPRGVRWADARPADVIVTAAGGLRGLDAVGEDALRAAASSAAADGARLVVVGRSDRGYVEDVLRRSAGAWTLQAVTTLHEDLDALLRHRATAELLLPLETALQPVAAAEAADRVARLVRTDAAGRVPDFGGPEVRLLEDLALAWVRAEGRRCRLVRRDRPRFDGAWVTPRRCGGRLGWEQGLAQRSPLPETVDGAEQPVGAEASGA